MAHALLLLLFIPLTKFARAHAHNRYICLNRFSSEYSIQNSFYTFKRALNHTTIKLYSMENIERAIKAPLAKRGLEFSLKDETYLYIGHCPDCIKNGEDVIVVLPTGYGLIMANIKIFQLLPDVRGAPEPVF